MSNQKRFVFGGSASGVAATIRVPVNTLNVQAASALPVIGGHSTSSVGAGGLPGFVQFQSASTTANGIVGVQAPPVPPTAASNNPPSNNPVATSTITASVRGLHVLNRFTVNVADVGITSQSAQDGKRGTPRLVNTQISGVVVDGFPLNVILKQNPFDDCVLNADKLIHCTIVEKIEWAQKPLPNAEIKGNSVVVPNFGTVFFGELLINCRSRHLTLVRFALGSPAQGDVSCSDVQESDPIDPDTGE
jgi:hypothetical protein